jgi:antirestriction protein
LFWVARRLKRGINRVDTLTAIWEQNMFTTAKIYVADLAAYNSGIMHGIWIENLLDLTDVEEQIAVMLSKSPIEDAEEYAIHDYEGFANIGIGEFFSIESVHRIALFLY